MFTEWLFENEIVLLRFCQMPLEGSQKMSFSQLKDIFDFSHLLWLLLMSVRKPVGSIWRPCGWAWTLWLYFSTVQAEIRTLNLREAQHQLQTLNANAALYERRIAPIMMCKIWYPSDAWSENVLCFLSMTRLLLSSVWSFDIYADLSSSHITCVTSYIQ